MRYFLLICCMALLAGCGTTFKVDEVPLQTPKVVAPKATPLDLKPIRWDVKKNGDVVTYFLDSENFKTLSLNFEELGRFIQEQKAVITFWETYENGNSTVDPKAKTK